MVKIKHRNYSIIKRSNFKNKNIVINSLTDKAMRYIKDSIYIDFETKGIGVTLVENGVLFSNNKGQYIKVPYEL